jgi:hypothetical protein
MWYFDRVSEFTCGFIPALQAGILQSHWFGAEQTGLLRPSDEVGLFNGRVASRVSPQVCARKE